MDDAELPALDLEVARLRSLLRERRRVDWEPDPRVEARIARQTTRWERLNRWMSGWRAFVLAVVFGVVVLAGLIG